MTELILTETLKIDKKKLITILATCHFNSKYLCDIKKIFADVWIFTFNLFCFIFLRMTDCKRAYIYLNKKKLFFAQFYNKKD